MSKVIAVPSIVLVLFALGIDALAVHIPDIQCQTILQPTKGGRCSDIVEASDQGYVVVGHVPSHPSAALYVARTEPNGTVAWQTIHGARDRTVVGHSIRQCSDGGYIITGAIKIFTQISDYDLYLVKVNADGIVQWTRTFGGVLPDIGHCVEQTSDGGFVVAGSTFAVTTGRMDCYLLKTDAEGNELWHKTYGGKMNDQAVSVHQTPDGGFLLCGSTESTGAGGEDLYLIKTDPNGILAWDRTYGGANDDSGACIAAVNDGGYVITGQTNSSGDGDGDIMLIKLDAQFQKVIQTTFDVGDSDTASSIRQCDDTGFIIAGATGQGLTSDALLVKTDAAGNLLWNKTCGGPAGDAAVKILQRDDTGYTLLGNTQSFDNYDTYAGFIIDADSDGLAAGDLDFNETIDITDFAIFSAAWQSTPADDAYNPSCNISPMHNSRIDAADLAAFAANWLYGN